MQKVSLLFSLLLISFFQPLIAQPPCGFDKLHQGLLGTDINYARQIEQNDVAIRNYIQSHPELLNRTSRTTAAYTIPVVVHVMHTGGAVGSIYNPTDAQITGAINYLNQVFAGTYAGMTAPVEGGGVVDIEIQFALAQRTPSCGATNGIDRVDASSLPNYSANGVNVNSSAGCSELSLKNLSRWNPADYYNIWVVNKIDGADGTSGQFIAGFAYFPGAPSTLDGTIMLATQLVSGQKTLPHEIGHALNLYHPFEGSADNTQCPANSNCATQGDRICDTDPIFNNYNSGTGAYSFACRTGANTCASPNNYTINTESNFMSYTSCYTLFTNGQKARAQAAMSLSSRASLVAPGNLALVPCGTTINFNVGTAGQTEDPTGTLAGCRRHRDYTYQLTIGATPSATATATLTYSGTAIKGLDYEVTTNGNFSSPSDVLTFNSGSTSAQTFTIRLYDDANVESAETIILDFNLNNGGGDATKGSTTPTLTLTLSDNDVAPVATSTATYAIGSLSTLITGAPFDARQQSQRSQYVYSASELLSAGINAGTINSLQLFINSKLSTRAFGGFTIKMAHTTVSNPVDGGVTVITGMTTVYSGGSYSTTAGWNLFTLTTPFAWNGTSNLAIEICYDNTTADAGNSADQVGCYADGSSATQGSMFFQNGINCAGSFSSVTYYNSGVKPIIRLGVAITGTQVETALYATSTSHIANGSNDYFYSNDNKLMLRLSGISTSLGCVTSSLEGSGTTWVSALGGQRSAKVFAVAPTTNGATTSYTISLYFENSELAGKNPATLRIAKTTAASMAAANSSNTVLMVPTVTTLGSGITVFTASFTGFSRLFLAENIVLPVSLMDFTASLNSEKNTVLKWSTAWEQNSRQFDIEVSNDALNYSYLATVNAAGNSNSILHYQYTHVRPPSGTSWYRLKQIDQDGNYKYSKIVAITIAKGQSEPYVYPVPARDVLTINFNTLTTKAKIEVLSADMRTIRTFGTSGALLKKDIPVNNLPAGIYFVRIHANGNSYIHRFIKE